MANSNTNPRPFRIQASGSIHDQTQIELDLDYPLIADQHRILNEHQVEFFLFCPTQIGINSKTYSVDSFYQDITQYFRFHTPNADQPETKFLESLGDRVRNWNLSLQSKTNWKADWEDSLKMFSNRMNTRFKRVYQNAMCQTGPLAPEEIEALMHWLKLFRTQAVDLLLTPNLQVPPPLRTFILLTDEYLSTRLESVFSAIIQKSKCTDTAFVQAYLDQEIQYRSFHPHINLNRSKHDDRENWGQRNSYLKKLMSEPLYLPIERVQQDRYYRNIVAAFAASLAAVWARLADLQTYRMTQANDYGLQFFTVLAIGVIAYVFKDRLKEVSRDYFSEKLKGKLPDYRSKILCPKFFLPYIDQTELGKMTEFVYFPAFERLDPELKFLRHYADPPNLPQLTPETIIRFSKTISPNKKVEPDQWAQMPSVKGIFRLDLTQFFKKMDDPTKNLSIYSSEEGVAEIEVPKVYHLHFLVKLTSKYQLSSEKLNATKKLEQWTDYLLYRIILNKEGVQRLENLIPQNKFVLHEAREHFND